jgi:hypothetical protein
MSMQRPVIAAFALFTALAPTLAQACWDGVAVTTDKVTIQRTDTQTWDPEDVRRWAKWTARIDALVPDGSHLDVFDGDASLCDADNECTEIGTGLTPFQLFERTADAVDATRPAIAAARRHDAMPYTVQVAASHDLRAAEQLAARINESDLGVHGFYEAGGFPAMNEFAHVVESVGSDSVTYHVVIGAFLAKAEAEAAQSFVASELGMRGFVTALDQWSITEEGC